MTNVLRRQQRAALGLFVGHAAALIASMGVASTVGLNVPPPAGLVLSLAFAALCCWHGIALIRVWDLYKAIRATADAAARLDRDTRRCLPI